MANGERARLIADGCTSKGTRTTVRGESFAVFLAAAPRAQRAALRLLVALAARPRGAALLKRLAPLDQLAGGLLGFGRYDDPQVSGALGWDAQAVVRRGRELRRAEGRP